MSESTMNQRMSRDDLLAAQARIFSPEFTQQFVREFQALDTAPMIELKIDAVAAWSVLAALQLAARHPGNTGAARRISESFARKLQESVATTPALRDLAEYGWRQELDVPVQSTPHGGPRLEEIERALDAVLPPRAGDRVQIVGDHPHSGKLGNVLGYSVLAVLNQQGMYVRCDDGSECFVTSDEHFRLLARAVR